MYWSNRDAANAAQGANEIAKSALVVSQRPWVKIKHRIIVPLTFDVQRNGGLMAMMTLEDSVENIGQSVAVAEFQWEELIPIDPDFSIRTARARQREYCDANRHPILVGVSGYALFPHDPAVSTSDVGVPMLKVMATQIHDRSTLNETVGGFVLVGCVYYRASFEPTSEPTIPWVTCPRHHRGNLPESHWGSCKQGRSSKANAGPSREHVKTRSRENAAGYLMAVDRRKQGFSKTAAKAGEKQAA